MDPSHPGPSHALSTTSTALHFSSWGKLCAQSRTQGKMSEPSESRHASSNGIEAKDHVSVTRTKSGRLQARSKVGRRRQHITPGSNWGLEGQLLFFVEMRPTASPITGQVLACTRETWWIQGTLQRQPPRHLPAMFLGPGFLNHGPDLGLTDLAQQSIWNLWTLQFSLKMLLSQVSL